MTYRTVFDVAGDDFSAWSFSEVGFILLAAAFVSVQLYRDRRNRTRSKLFVIVFMAIGFTGLLGSFPDQARSKQRAHDALRSALSSGAYVTVEGVVQNYSPEPKGGRSDETFEVAGHHYRYSHFLETAGYHASRYHGGVIREGMQVRIADVQGVIARLEVADSAHR